MVRSPILVRSCIFLRVGKTVGKALLIGGANVVAGPLGGMVASTIVATGDVALNLKEGNYKEAVVEVVFGFVTVASYGVSALAYDAAKEGAKEAAEEVVKEAAKKATEKAGQVALEGLTGAAKEAAVNAATESAKLAAKEMNDQLAKELATGLSEHAASHAFRASMRVTAGY